MSAQHVEGLRFQTSPQLHSTPAGRRSAREELASIHRVRSVGRAPTPGELHSWAFHPDERVPIAAIDTLLELLRAPLTSGALIVPVSGFFRTCTHRAIEYADRQKLLWTPLLDALAHNVPWWHGNSFSYANDLVHEKAQLVEDYLVAHPDAATVDLLTAVQERRIRNAVFAQMSCVDERAVRRILASDDVPPEGMTTHRGLTPEATDAIWELLRRSYRARLLSFPKVQKEHHEILDRELAYIGDLLRHGALADGEPVPILDGAYLEDLLVLLDRGLGPSPAAEIALTIVELDRSGDAELIGELWRALSRQNLQHCFHFEAAYAHPHYSEIATEVVMDLVHKSGGYSGELFVMLERAPVDAAIADCMASARNTPLVFRAWPHMSPGVFRKVFVRMASDDALWEGALDRATQAQVAAIARTDWKPLLKSDQSTRDSLLARIPSARTSALGRALLLASTNPAVLGQMCRSNELSISECVSLFDRIVALDPTHALLPLQDSKIVRALTASQLMPLLSHADSQVRSAALMASATVRTDNTATLRRPRRAKAR